MVARIAHPAGSDPGAYNQGKNMIKTKLEQGSAEWHQHRAAHRNASDSSAVMGESKYKTRADFMHDRFTGISAEPDEMTQRIFNEGHRSEALARPLAESIVGDDLYPVTGTNGLYSASFDGLTMGKTPTAFEHKSLNDSLRGIADGADLPLHYRIQIEHQLYVCDGEKCLFMATKWDGDELVEEMHCWYFPDLDLRARIFAAWDQFADDLAAYKPRDITEKPQAESILTLPALLVQAKGEITAHNLPAFKQAAATFLASMTTTFATDQDFANGKAQAASLRDGAKKLKAKKDEMLTQTVTIGEMAREIDALVETFNKTALSMEKKVEAEEKRIKADIANEAKVKFAELVAQLEAGIAPIRLVFDHPDFAAAMKNQRTLNSLHNKVDTHLAEKSAEVKALATDISVKLTWKSEAAISFEFLFADLQAVIHKPFDDFKLLVEKRIVDHKAAVAAKEEAQRLAMQAEADRKAKADADALIAAERAKMEAEAKAAAAAEQQRIDAAAKAKRDLEAKAQAEEESARIATAKMFAEVKKAEAQAERDAELVAIEERRRIDQCKEQERPAATVTPIKTVDMVTIPKALHEQLLRDSELLNCLRRAGVDNWLGWDDAIEMLNGEAA